MRVLYPISARISDLINDGAEVSAGWMMLWSVFCIVLLALVLLALPSYEAGAADRQHEHFSTIHLNHAVHVSGVHIQQNIEQAHAIGHSSATNKQLHASTQDYINAHRCARYIACIDPVRSNPFLVAPTKPKASVDQYL